MLSNLLQAELVWIPLGVCIQNYYLQNCLFVFCATFAASFGNLLAYVAALLVTSFCRLLKVRGRENRV